VPAESFRGHNAGVTDPGADDSQLALDVEPYALLEVRQSREGDLTELRLGPLPEPTLRTLAGLLLNRKGPPEDAGPWRCAVAGGSRELTLVPTRRR
jgi:hypothetical protein